MSCCSVLRRTPSIMPEGKMQMFTGFGPVITQQALKSGFEAERSLTNTSRLVLNHLRDTSAWMSERCLGISRSHIDQCPGSPPKPLPALVPIPAAAQTFKSLLTPTSCKSYDMDGRLSARPDRCSRVKAELSILPVDFLKEGKRLPVNKGHCIFFLFSSNTFHGPS